MRYCAALIFFSLLILNAPFAHGQERTLNIIYTGGMDGELEPCGCSPKTDFGGVARLSGYLSVHAGELSPYVLIDAGNFSGRDDPQGRLKTEAMLKSFSIIGYDAVALSENERGLPQEFLSPIIVKYKVPAIPDPSSGRDSIPGTWGDMNINITVDPKKVRKDSLNVLLTDRPVSEAGDMNGWDVIISSSGETLEAPVKVNGTVISAGRPKGKSIGMLAVRIDDKGRIGSFSHRWQPLGSEINEDQRVRDILDEYDTMVARLLKETERPVAGTTYVGAGKCAECHQPFVESWEKTRHSRAFFSLEQAGKSADPECLVCHTVGFGKKGGFYSFETTPELANVQCEVCHGLNREHVEDYSKTTVPVSEAVCLNCHTRDKSPDFNYPVYLEKIKH